MCPSLLTFSPVFWRGLVRDLALLLGEERCQLCSVPVSRGRNAASSPRRRVVLCPACDNALARRVKGFCDRCGEIAPWPGLPLAPCSVCLTKPRPWEAFFMHGAYAGALREALLRFKTRGETSLALLLGGLLAEHPNLRQGEYQGVVPLPLHHARLMERGFNQALEIARPVAAALNAPLILQALSRAANTRHQTGLHGRERRDNIRGAFVSGPDAGAVHGKRVLLIDDVATTGATLEEATLALLRAGAASVHVAVAARTPTK